MRFYERPEAERIAMTNTAMRHHSTIVSRWTALNDKEAEGWAKRARYAAEWLTDCRRVLDLGCGTMLLEQFLSSSVSYYPSDVIPRDERTMVYDLNNSPPPIIDTDAVACLGLIEYLHHPGRLFKSLIRHKRAVVSYNVAIPSVAVESRRAHGWVNDYSLIEMEEIFTHNGWSVLRDTPLGGNQHLWLIKSD